MSPIDQNRRMVLIRSDRSKQCHPMQFCFMFCLLAVLGKDDLWHFFYFVSLQVLEVHFFSTTSKSAADLNAKIVLA